MASKKDEIILSYEDVLLRKSDLELLNPGNWLNDNLISFWFSYLQNQLIPTQLFTAYCCLCPELSQIIKSAQQSTDMFNELKQILSDYEDKNVFFVAINDCDYSQFGGSHWSLLVFKPHCDQQSRAKHYDSGVNSANIRDAEIIANILNRILCDDNPINVTQENCIKQINGYDCGIHLLANCEALIRMLFIDENSALSKLASLRVIENKRNEIKNTILELKSKDEI